ncbi:glycosyltransferase family 4 protein [Rubrivirga sp. IMCC45206]|uniref:glycosyltransferase family 4 protein n=1 Tax=Rubrivirga sp. IMCC45206 TaxID=3391614 RepID=UPI00398FDA0D
MSRPRIVFAAPFPPPFTGQTVATARFAELAEGGADVERHDLVDPARHARASGAFRVGRALDVLRVARALRRRLRDAPADVLYLTPSASAVGHLRDRAVLWAGRAHAQRVVGHVHNGNWAELFDGPLAGSARSLVRQLDAVCFLSPALASRARAHVPAGKTQIVPNTPAPDLLFSEAEVEARIRQRTERSSFRVAFISNMMPSKGYAVLADALERLAAGGLAVEADFVGGWPAAEERDAFEHRLASAGLAARVHGPVTDRRAIRAVLAEADAFVLPTTYPHEAQPLSIIEALNAGVPVVATAHASIPDMVGEGGALVEPTADAVAGAIEALVDPDAWAVVARAARADFERQFSATAVSAALHSALLGERGEA